MRNMYHITAQIFHLVAIKSKKYKLVLKSECAMTQ